MKRLFTSESVTEGHPDKVCDQVSDAILQAILEKDPYARVACETVVTTGLVLVVGEITTECFVDIKSIAKRTIKEIGYTNPEYGFDAETCAVLVAIDEQSADIKVGVDTAMEKRGSGEEAIGAGDQGMMIGYACNETEELMPLPIMLAHKLARRLSEVRKKEILDYLRPDGKSQVTVEYEDDKPVRVHTIVLSTQHDDVDISSLEKDMVDHVIKEVVSEEMIDEETRILINPTGRFVIGGPVGDSGLTGRKIIVDTYGGYAGHGGGAFSGKDPTKVDRSGAYMARYIAKNIVAAGIADKVEIELAYAIGVEMPVSIFVNTFGTGVLTDLKIVEMIQSLFDLTPSGIIKKLKLREQKYRNTAAYGHFGRNENQFTWEKCDMVDSIKVYLEKDTLILSIVQA